MTVKSLDEQLVNPEDNNVPFLTSLQADSIDGVIESLTKIVDWSISQEKKTGYFAALYRKVTIKIKEGIEAGAFEDNGRMEKLDVIFANRYLEAFEQYINDQPMTRSWWLAFDLTEKWEPIVLMHLMIGMNAHINLDLGIAAAKTVSPDKIATLKNDFDKINLLLASLVNEVQRELAKIWPMFKYLDKWAGNNDEKLADFGMKLARGEAWKLAQEYVAADEVKRKNILHKRDCEVELMGKLLARPGLQLRLFLLLVRLGERQKVSDILKILA